PGQARTAEGRRRPGGRGRFRAFLDLGGAGIIGHGFANGPADIRICNSIRRESAAVLRRGRRPERGLDFVREILITLGQGLLLLLEGLHANREGLLVLLELLLQRLAIVLLDEQHPDALVHRRIVLDLDELFQGPFDLAQLRFELHPLAPEDLELVLQLLVLGNLILKLWGNLLHDVTSRRTRAATSAHRRYEFTAARNAPVSSASIVRVSRFRSARIETRAFGTSRPASGRNDR